MFEKTYELPITREYVRDWGMLEAIRELIQNAIDSESPFEWEFTDDTLRITSKYAKLEPSTLLLGTTSKADNDDAIGNFGEGYKIAMLVLTREDYVIHIHNSSKVWVPSFETSKKFGAEVLTIKEVTNQQSNQGVSFYISGLDEADIINIKKSCLQMTTHIGEVKTTKYGDILLEHPGILYVGGLYICNTQLEYGYNIHPQHLKLERDRQTVDGWDLKYVTRDMWFETEEYDQIATLMEANCPDLDHAEYSCPELVQNACYELFQKENPEALIADSHDEMKRLVAKGLTNTVYIGSTAFSSSVKRSYGYTTERPKIEAKANPTTELEAWFKLNRKHMRKGSIIAFKELLTLSQDWSN